MSTPATTNTWRVVGSDGLDSMRFIEAEPIPELQDNEVLVHIKAAALNSRDASIPFVSRLTNASDDLRGPSLLVSRKASFLARMVQAMLWR